ncbi:MAG: class 1 fructose-bisphosphatase [Alphaproteobacteria bacterium]|nr:class 1 fructose-bisphosphatase [Alphaproteobacteria bacterium]
MSELADVLARRAKVAGGRAVETIPVILALADAAARLAAFVAQPSADGSHGAYVGAANSDGDAQRKLDLVAEEICQAAARASGVGPYLSEETEAALTLDPAGALAMAIDPLDGSSNIAVNGVIGTIFALLPAPPGSLATPALAFAQPGHAVIASGFFMYGPQTRLVVSLGAGVDIFALDPDTGRFVLFEAAATVPAGGREFAINASNARHWAAPVRRYIDACLEGADGPRGVDFNMRWAGSMVADVYRLLGRGGVFLYPSDARSNYAQGRLRLVYEAFPMAFLIEQAGGRAIDGHDRILDLTPSRPHQRIPLILGEAEEVEVLRRLHADDLGALSEGPASRRGAA